MADSMMNYCNNCDEKSTFENGDDGFYYCNRCGAQSQEVVDTTGLSDQLFNSGLYNPNHSRSLPKFKSQPSTNPFKTLTPLPKLEQDELKPFSFEDEIYQPLDFGNAWMNQGQAPDDETMANCLRLRYVEGLQVMIQLQCQVLVERFGVTPAICGLAGTFWLRFLASSRVFDKDWANDAINDSELGRADAAKLEEDLIRLGRRHKGEPRNSHGQRFVMIWCKALKRRIPLRTSLAICFLSCHIAREAILPTDISKWVREGKLPYMSAFHSIEKYIGGPSRACPLSSKCLFWPPVGIEPTILETHAATVAENIGLLLPPVNFYAIARRYLEQLSLPTEKILSHACRIFEWSMPPDLWLSTNTGRLPTRVCVMSVLIVSIRILYNINGFGKWEMSLPNRVLKKLATSPESPKKANVAKECDPIVDSCEVEMDIKTSRSSSTPSFELDTTELLCHLEKVYDKLVNANDYSKDLLSYLKYCKDVVFSGLRTSYEEDNFIDQLWNLYANQEDIKPSVVPGTGCCVPKRSRDEGNVTSSTDYQRSKNVTNSTDCQRSRDVTNSTDYQRSSNGSLKQKKSSNKRCPSMSMDNSNNKEDDTNNHMKKPFEKKNNHMSSRGSPCSSDFKSDYTLPDHTWMTPKEEMLRKIQSDMEMNSFHYLPPRTHSKHRPGYVCHERKSVCGKWSYVADVDYYILLRACARLAEIDIRIMHLGVSKLERRLSWIEKRIDSSLKTVA